MRSDNFCESLYFSIKKTLDAVEESYVYMMYNEVFWSSCAGASGDMQKNIVLDLTHLQNFVLDQVCSWKSC